MANSATEMAKRLDISRSYLYYLKENTNIEFETNDSGKVLWNEEVYKRIKDYLARNVNEEHREIVEPRYKTTKINNRRYLKKKYKWSIVK